MLAAVRDTGYNVVLLLHLVAVVAAFGPALLYPLLRRAGAGGVAADAHQRISVPALALAGIFGGSLIGMTKLPDGELAFNFGQAWLSIASALWVVLLLVAWFGIRPALRRGADGDAAAAKRAAALTGVLHLGLVVQIYLMVFKPGL